MRDALIRFIREVQANASRHRHQIQLGSLFGTSQQDKVPSISFGYGYYQPYEVMWRLGEYYEMLSVEEAADKFLEFYSLVDN